MEDPSGEVEVMEQTADDELQEEADVHLESLREEEILEVEQWQGEKSEETQEQDPYAYTKRDEFTSESFKIEVRGLPKYFSLAQLKKMMNETLQLNAHKVKPAGAGKRFVYVNFRNEEARQKGLHALNGYKWKNNSVLKTSLARPAEDPLIAKEIEEEVEEEEAEEPPKKKANIDESLSIEKRVEKSVTPFAHLPYEEQLKEKEKMALNVMRKFGSDLKQHNPELRNWVFFHKLRRKGQVCEVDPIVPSPVTEGYRNKCEFTVGINPETELPVVGFRIASYKEGSVSVGPIDHLVHIPDKMKAVVKAFEGYVRNSGLAPFSPKTHEGVWRQLTVRTTRNDDLLVIVVIHPQQNTQEELNELKEDLVNFFTSGEGGTVGVTSVFFQSTGQKESGVAEEYEHLWGNEFLTETILDKTFRVSVDAFLQVNTAAAEVLYQKIAEVAELDGTSNVLDICCGTGTIGISLAEQCLKVYGVELVKKAAEDAKHNAAENGLANVAIFTGKAEDKIGNIIENADKCSTVGIVDPPRAGLHATVVAALRRAGNLNHIVYVSCDPGNAKKNFLNLCRPKSKQYKGEFFIPIRAIPVDLFPHTPHYELIVLFERWEERKWRRIMDGNPLPRDAEYFARIPSKPEGSSDQLEFMKAESNTGYGTWMSVPSRNEMRRAARAAREANTQQYSFSSITLNDFGGGNGFYNQGYDEGYNDMYNEPYNASFDSSQNALMNQNYGEPGYGQNFQGEGYNRPSLLGEYNSRQNFQDQGFGRQSLLGNFEDPQNSEDQSYGRTGGLLGQYNNRQSGDDQSYGRPSLLGQYNNRQSGDDQSYGRPSLLGQHNNRQSGDNQTYGRGSLLGQQNNRQSGDDQNFGRTGGLLGDYNRQSGDDQSYGRDSLLGQFNDGSSGGGQNFGRTGGLLGQGQYNNRQSGDDQGFGRTGGLLGQGQYNNRQSGDDQSFGRTGGLLGQGQYNNRQSGDDQSFGRTGGLLGQGQYNNRQSGDDQSFGRTGGLLGQGQYNNRQSGDDQSYGRTGGLLGQGQYNSRLSGDNQNFGRTGGLLGQGQYNNRQNFQDTSSNKPSLLGQYNQGGRGRGRGGFF